MEIIIISQVLKVVEDADTAAAMDQEGAAPSVAIAAGRSAAAASACSTPARCGSWFSA